MDRQYRRFAGTSFSLCDILRPFTKGSEGNSVKFTVLLAGKTTGPPAGDMLFFCSMNHRCFGIGKPHQTQWKMALILPAEIIMKI
jgi:hypothetical protein